MSQVQQLFGPTHGAREFRFQQTWPENRGPGHNSVTNQVFYGNADEHSRKLRRGFAQESDSDIDQDRGEHDGSSDLDADEPHRSRESKQLSGYEQRRHPSSNGNIDKTPDHHLQQP